MLRPGSDHDYGPVTVGTVIPDLPRGTYAFNCRFVDPVTGEQQTLDLNPFSVTSTPFSTQ